MLQPPTDNLYKFLAIAGISIMLFSIGFSGQKYVEFELMELELQGKMRILKQESKIAESETSDLIEWKEAMELRHAQTRKPFQSDEIAAFSKKTESLLSKAYDNKRAIVQTTNYAFQVVHFKKWLSIYAWATAIGSTIGLIMSITGFMLWYIRVQKYADKEIKVGVTTKNIQKKRWGFNS